jgi:S-adenosyl-L-methionine hydrolase (adenosine-forming)
MSIITFTTDTGETDSIIGTFKGLLLQKIANAQFVDISLHIERQNIMQAGYIAGAAIFYYPKNSFHIVMVDVFKHKNFSTIMAYYNNQYIICPNNGVLHMILKHQTPDWVIELPLFQNFENYTLQFGAQCAYGILNILHNKPYNNIGTTIATVEKANELAPIVGSNFIEAQILFIDKFENIVLNITKTQFQEIIGNKKFTIVMRNISEITKVHNHYGEVGLAVPVAIFNMAGYLEIALTQGNASGLFGLQLYNEFTNTQGYIKNRSNYQTVRIVYEIEA